MKNLITGIFLAGLLGSCNDSDPRCLGNLSCTEELVIIDTQVLDSQENRVELDSTHTINSSGGVEYRYINDGNEIIDRYIVLTDSEMDEVDFSGTDLTMIGWKDGNLLFEEVFTIGNNCCHIELIDGPEIIQLDHSFD